MTSPTMPTEATSADGERQLSVAAIVFLGALVFAALRQGAYHQWQHQVFAILIAATTVGLVATGIGRQAATVAAVIVSPLLLSTAVSTVFATDRSDVRSTVLEILMVGIGLAVGASIARSQLDVAINAVVLVAIIIAATAIWGVATHTTPWGRITEGVWRGSSSLTYANAAASVVGPVALLTFIRAARTNSRWLAASTTFLTIGFASTQSRGGALAIAIVGLAVVVYLGLRDFSSTAIPVGLGVAIGTPLLLAAAPTGSTPRTAIVVIMVVLGTLATAGAWSARSRIPQPAAVLAGLVGALIVSALATGLADPVTERLTLRSGTTAQGEGAGVLFGDRAIEWSTAWDLFSERPVVGHGPGVVDLRWTEDGRQFSALFVHNEYLEFAVTHGLVGLVALIAAGTLAGRRSGFDDETWPLGFAIVGFLVHSTVDFLWHIPALPVLFAFVLGLAVGRSAPMAASD